MSQPQRPGPSKLPRREADENLAQTSTSKGKVRPDGPGDETAPVERDDTDRRRHDRRRH